MRENLLIIYHIILSVSFLCSLTVYFRKTEFRYLRLFAPFLFLTLVVEIGALVIDGINYNKIYNLFYLVAFNFYFIIQGKIIKTPLFKKALKIIILLYTIFAIIDMIFIQGFDYAITYSITLASLFLVVFCIICFNEIFKSPPFFVKNPAFWICTGLIIFFACTLPVQAANHIFIGASPEEYEVLTIMFFVTNYVLYSSFAMAFLSERVFKNSAAEKEIS